MVKKSLRGQLTKEEIERLESLLKDDERFEKMVDRAVRGMWGHVRRPRKIARSS